MNDVNVFSLFYLFIEISIKNNKEEIEGAISFTSCTSTDMSAFLMKNNVHISFTKRSQILEKR